jgi:hypothetical protein
VALSLSLFLSLSLSFPPRSGVQTEKTTKNKQIQVLFVFLTFLLVNLWFLFVFYIGFGTREGFPNISCQFLEPQNIFPLSISLFGLPSFSLSLSLSLSFSLLTFFQPPANNNSVRQKTNTTHKYQQQTRYTKQNTGAPRRKQTGYKQTTTKATKTTPHGTNNRCDTNVDPRLFHTPGQLNGNLSPAAFSGKTSGGLSWAPRRGESARFLIVVRHTLPSQQRNTNRNKNNTKKNNKKTVGACHGPPGGERVPGS